MGALLWRTEAIGLSISPALAGCHLVPCAGAQGWAALCGAGPGREGPGPEQQGGLVSWEGSPAGVMLRATDDSRPHCAEASDLPKVRQSSSVQPVSRTKLDADSAARAAHLAQRRDAETGGVRGRRDAFGLTPHPLARALRRRRPRGSPGGRGPLKPRPRGEESEGA